MTQNLVEQLVPPCLVEIRKRLEKALARARSAEANINIGELDIALELALDIEVLTYEANVLLNAASLAHRIASEG